MARHKQKRFEDYAQRLAVLHASGLSIRQLCQELGLCLATVHKWSTRLGLVPHCEFGKPRPQDQERARAKQDQTARSEGLSGRIDYANGPRYYEVARRWPGAASIRQCDILDFMAEHPDGVRSTSEVASLLHIHGTRLSALVNARRHLVNLTRLGLVEQAGSRIEEHLGHRSRVRLWKLSEHARRRATPQPRDIR